MVVEGGARCSVHILAQQILFQDDSHAKVFPGSEKSAHEALELLFSVRGDSYIVSKE